MVRQGGLVASGGGGGGGGGGVVTEVGVGGFSGAAGELKRALSASELVLSDEVRKSSTLNLLHNQ